MGKILLLTNSNEKPEASVYEKRGLLFLEDLVSHNPWAMATLAAAGRYPSTPAERKTAQPYRRARRRPVAKRPAVAAQKGTHHGDIRA